MNRGKRKGVQEQNLREKEIIRLSLDKFFLKLCSMTLKKVKRGLKGVGGQIGAAFVEGKEGMTKRVGHIEKIFKEDTSAGKKEERTITKPPRPDLEQELRSFRNKHTSPRPEITLFRPKQKTFFAYSTAEDEEKRDDTYFSVLATADSDGRNIVKALTSISDPLENFSLETSAMFSFLPVKEEMLCFGRIKTPWLFVIRSHKFSKKRLLRGKNTGGTAYSFNDVKLFIDSNLDLLLKAPAKREKDRIYPELVESLKHASRSLLTEQNVRKVLGSEEHHAFYLLHTPKSRLSPFLLIQLSKAEQVRAHIFPVWFNYEENKLINTAKEIKKTYRSLPY